MRLFYVFVFSALLLPAQTRDTGQRQTEDKTGAVIAVTPRAFHGSGAPGAIAGNLSQDTYLDTGASPAVKYDCAAPAGTPAPACGAVAAGQWQAAGASGGSIYNVLNYHASGMKTTTALSASSGATSATVGSCATFLSLSSQGLYIIGAGPAGAIFVDTVVSCVANTLTWSTPTSTTVTGATVGHEDHTAINNAIAAAFNGGGGKVYFPAASGGTDGVYNCFVLNSVTGGCVSFPQSLAYTRVITVGLAGEVRGVDDATGQSMQYGSGINCRLALNVSTIGSATKTGCVAPAPYVAATNGNLSTVWLPVNVMVEHLLIDAPNQSRLDGLMLSNVMQASVDDVYAVAVPDSNGSFSQPTGGSTGIRMPQFLNNIISTVSRTASVGFSVDFDSGEHTTFNLATGQYGNYCLAVTAIEHMISGELDCEASKRLILSTSTGFSGTKNTIDLKIDGEVLPSGSAWWVRGSADIDDTGNYLYGILNYSLYDNTNGGYATIVKNGGANLRTCNLSAPPTAGACTP